MKVTNTPHFLPAVHTPAGQAPNLNGVENMNNNLDEQPRCVRLLRDPLRNNGSAFTEVERDARGLRGLLLLHVHTQDERAARVLQHIRNLDEAQRNRGTSLALRQRQVTIPDYAPLHPGHRPCGIIQDGVFI